MNRRVLPVAVKLLGLVLVFMTTATALHAHIILHDPNGGEVLDVGSVQTITWEVWIEHNTQNWDLWYSTSGPSGPWKEIALDLPTGDPTAGSIHTYDWVVPEDISGKVRVRVIQDNLVEDFEDISDEDLSIVYLVFEANPNPVGPGMTLTLDARGSSLPGAPVALFLVAANGSPLFVPLLFGNLNGQGAFNLISTIPPGLSGLKITLRIYAMKPSGEIVAGNDVKVLFL